MNLRIWTDGACSGNPGPAGWAYYMEAEVGGLIKEPTTGSGFIEQGTNNIAELTAVLEAMHVVSRLNSELDTIEICSDSQYVIQGITKWIHNWKLNDWRGSNKKPIKNKELWQALDSLVSKTQVPIVWTWVKGHSGQRENEIVDSLAVAAYLPHVKHVKEERIKEAKEGTRGA